MVTALTELDHVAAAATELAGPYLDDADTQAICGVYAARIQQIENILWRMYLESIFTATGLSLQQWAAARGLSVATGTSDEVLRNMLRFRAALSSAEAFDASRRNDTTDSVTGILYAAYVAGFDPEEWLLTELAGGFILYLAGETSLSGDVYEFLPLLRQALTEGTSCAMVYAAPASGTYLTLGGATAGTPVAGGGFATNAGTTSQKIPSVLYLKNLKPRGH